MHYVLVHGTTQSPAGWDPLVRALVARGHGAERVDLPTHLPDLDSTGYAAVAAEQVGHRVESPTVVAHSGAGALAPAVAARLGSPRVVWLAAFLPDFAARRSLADEIAQSRDRMFNPEWTGLTVPPTDDPVAAAHFLFHDCDLHTLRWALSTLRLFSPAAVYRQTPDPLPPGVRCTYVLPRHDRTLRPSWMREAAAERLGVAAVEIDAGHCPHVSTPERVCDILEG